jgi:uncharacterized protein
MLIKLVEFFVTKLVNKPEGVIVTEVKAPEKDIIEIRVAAPDLARVIGKEGRTFKALRALANAADPHTRKDIVVDISS